MIRTVLGDRDSVPGLIYAHEHLIIDSPLIADRWPHILLDSVEDAVTEVLACARAGVGLMVDAMPVAAGRDVLRLAEISRQTGVEIVAATGLHHDRYYGPLHWSNRVSADELAELFVVDLVQGIDEFDYTSPIVRRTTHRAGIVKVATSGPTPDARDLRNLSAAAQASVRTGAPVLTHCEDGRGGLAQVQALTSAGVPAGSVILSHVDKAGDPGYAVELAACGAVVELDQNLRQADAGVAAGTLEVIERLIEAGFEDRIVLGTDGARRSLWTVHGGSPGLAWLATGFAALLTERGLTNAQVRALLGDNARRALSWRPVSG